MSVKKRRGLFFGVKKNVSLNGKRTNTKQIKQDKALMQEERKHLLSVKSDFFIREAYKTLRTNVSFSLTGEEVSKTVLVTSSLQSEGKSITAVNLAISYAQTDRKVVIIDCEGRNLYEEGRAAYLKDKK